MCPGGDGGDAGAGAITHQDGHGAGAAPRPEGQHAGASERAQTNPRRGNSLACVHVSSRLVTLRHACVSVFFFRFVALLKRHGPFVVHLAGCGVSGVNLCSRDTASRDHAFPGLLASPTLVSKTPRGRCVNRVKHPLLRLFSTPK